MNTSSRSRRRPRTNAVQRAQLLAAFAASGLSATAFARQHGLHYPTFCGWRQRQIQATPALGFVQVELPAAAPPAELILELGAGARLRLTSADQFPLAARLLHHLHATTPC